MGGWNQRPSFREESEWVGWGIWRLCIYTADVRTERVTVKDRNVADVTYNLLMPNDTYNPMAGGRRRHHNHRRYLPISISHSSHRRTKAHVEAVRQKKSRKWIIHRKYKQGQDIKLNILFNNNNNNNSCCAIQNSNKTPWLCSKMYQLRVGCE